jgi:hypothetical protein
MPIDEGSVVGRRGDDSKFVRIRVGGCRPWRTVSAPVRARKIARPSQPSSRDGVKRSPYGGDPRTIFFVYYILPALIAGGIAAGVLLWHILFGAGIVGLLVFLASTLLALAFTFIAVYDWVRGRRR